MQDIPQHICYICKIQTIKSKIDTCNKGLNFGLRPSNQQTLFRKTKIPLDGSVGFSTKCTLHFQNSSYHGQSQLILAICRRLIFGLRPNDQQTIGRPKHLEMGHQGIPQQVRYIFKVQAIKSRIDNCNTGLNFGLWPNNQQTLERPKHLYMGQQGFPQNVHYFSKIQAIMFRVDTCNMQRSEFWAQTQ